MTGEERQRVGQALSEEEHSLGAHFDIAFQGIFAPDSANGVSQKRVAIEVLARPSPTGLLADMTVDRMFLILKDTDLLPRFTPILLRMIQGKVTEYLASHSSGAEIPPLLCNMTGIEVMSLDMEALQETVEGIHPVRLIVENLEWGQVTTNMEDFYAKACDIAELLKSPLVIDDIHSFEDVQIRVVPFLTYAARRGISEVLLKIDRLLVQRCLDSDSGAFETLESAYSVIKRMRMRGMNIQLIFEGLEFSDAINLLPLPKGDRVPGYGILVQGYYFERPRADLAQAA